jgi:hypothetical protein
LYFQGDEMMRLATVLGVALFALPGVAGTISYTFTTFDFPGSASTEVFGINDSGKFTGFWSLGAPAGTARNGFSASIGGSATTINDSNGFANTSPAGINDAGILVGCAGTCGGLTAQANTSFSFNGTTWTNFDPTGLSGTLASSTAAGINSSGLIVGSYIATVSGIKGSHGYVDSNGTFTSFNDPGNVNGTLATGVNNGGDIVGFYLLSGVLHGFKTSTSNLTSFTEIFDSGGSQTAAQGIDTNGDIVGFFKDITGTNHGFIDIGGVFTTLDDPLSPESGGNGSQILGVSPDGTKIVGDYLDANGNTHGFYATLNTASVPEPGTVLLSLSGIGLLAGWGWRRQRRASK